MKCHSRRIWVHCVHCAFFFNHGEDEWFQNESLFLSASTGMIFRNFLKHCESVSSYQNKLFQVHHRLLYLKTFLIHGEDHFYQNKSFDEHLRVWDFKTLFNHGEDECYYHKSILWFSQIYTRKTAIEIFEFYHFLAGCKFLLWILSSSIWSALLNLWGAQISLLRNLPGALAILCRLA